MKTTQHSKPEKYFENLETLGLQASPVSLNDWVIWDNDKTQIAKVTKTSMGYAWQFASNAIPKIQANFQKLKSNGSFSVLQTTQTAQTMIH